MAKRGGEAKRASALLAELARERIAVGVCRHCGGPVPCWSEFGDQRVGVRHSTHSHRAMRRAANEWHRP
jgi:hypothetical protein